MTIMVVAETIAAVALKRVAESVANPVPDSSRVKLTSTFTELVAKRKVFGAKSSTGKVFLMNCPIVRILETTYSKCMGGVHVLYAPSSFGKTSAGMAFLMHSLPSESSTAGEQLPYGLMFSDMLNSDYFSSMSTKLLLNDTESSFDWLDCLLAALDNRPASTMPSVLILDDFDQAAEDSANEFFVKTLYRRINILKHTVVFIISQDEDAAAHTLLEWCLEVAKRLFFPIVVLKVEPRINSTHIDCDARIREKRIIGEKFTE